MRQVWVAMSINVLVYLAAAETCSPVKHSYLHEVSPFYFDNAESVRQTDGSGLATLMPNQNRITNFLRDNII